MESAIQLTNVSKAFGKFKAVDNLSLNVPKGAMFGNRELLAGEVIRFP